MAKLSVHGSEIGRIVYTAKTKAYMSDGKVLVNYGDGWKIAGKIKPEFTPESAFQSANKRRIEFLECRPAIAKYIKCLHSLACPSKRYKLHTAVSLMPSDCDGVWSEACDGYGDNISAGVDEIYELCALYIAAMNEQKSFKQLQAA